MGNQKRYFLDIAHMHPVCPLSLSHARIFILADVWARRQRKQRRTIRFPVCMHYSGSTVFKITNAISRLQRKKELTETNKKTIELLLDFYKIPKERLNDFTNPSRVLDYFSEVILNDLKSINISCDYNDYFNTTNEYYQEFVRSIFNIYRGKKFITSSDRGKSLDYNSTHWKTIALERLRKTKFTPPTASTMITESIQKLDNEWSFERSDSIGTQIDGYVIDPMFDAEFLSIFNAIYPYLKQSKINSADAKDIFKELLDKIDNPDKNASSFIDKLYLKLLEVLPVDIFFVERHLQNWVAKRIYTEVILLPPDFSTKEYFFLGSITKNGKTDSASRGHGITLSHLIEKAGPENARLTLLFTFGVPHRNYELNSTLQHIQNEVRKFNNFIEHLRKYSVEKHYEQIIDILQSKNKDIEDFISRGNMRKVLLLLLNKLPKMIKPMIEDVPSKETTKKRAILDFFSRHIEILCPSLNEKLL